MSFSQGYKKHGCNDPQNYVSHIDLNHISHILISNTIYFVLRSKNKKGFPSLQAPN